MVLQVLTIAATFSILSPAAQRSGALRVGVALPEGNRTVGLPAIADSLSSESLVVLGLDGRISPRLAQSWSRSADGKGWQFTIAQGIRLHDGTLADAVKIAALLKAAVTRPELLQFHPRLRELEEIRADGDRSLFVRTQTPRVLTIDELADVTMKTGSPDAGIGPFIVETLSRDALKVRAFNEYFGGQPAVPAVHFRTYRSQRAAWTGLMRDEIDALYEVNRDSREFVERNPSLQVRSFFRPYVAGLVFNVRRPQFRDPAVRRALGAVVNRSEIVNVAYRGRAQAAVLPLSPEHWLVRQTSASRPDPSREAALLQKMPLKGGGEQMPARVRFRCLVPVFETQPFERLALVLQRQLYSVGVDMSLETVSVQSLLQRLPAGDFDAALMEFLSATPAWLPYFWHSDDPRWPTLFHSGYSAADRELNALDDAADERALRRAAMAVFGKMATDPPAIFLASPEVTRVVSTRFEVPVEKGRDIMGRNLWLWRPAKER